MGIVATALPDFLAGIPQETPKRFRFASLPTRRSAEKTSPSKFQLLKGLSEIHDDLIRTVIAQTSKEDFDTARRSLFGSYQRLTRSLCELIPVAFDAATVERLSTDSLNELHEKFAVECLPRFGETTRDQATFTVWIFQKIASLMDEIEKLGPPPDELLERDIGMARDFGNLHGWAQFHMDCLTEAIHIDKPLSQEILDEVVDGLRAAVNAHSIIKQAVMIRRVQVKEGSPIEIGWDEEEQELLDSSMSGFAMESIEDALPSR